MGNNGSAWAQTVSESVDVKKAPKTTTAAMVAATPERPWRKFQDDPQALEIAQFLDEQERRELLPKMAFCGDPTLFDDLLLPCSIQGSPATTIVKSRGVALTAHGWQYETKDGRIGSATCDRLGKMLRSELAREHERVGQAPQAQWSAQNGVFLLLLPRASVKQKPSSVA